MVSAGVLVGIPRCAATWCTSLQRPHPPGALRHVGHPASGASHFACLKKRLQAPSSTKVQLHKPYLTLVNPTSCSARALSQRVTPSCCGTRHARTALCWPAVAYKLPAAYTPGCAICAPPIPQPVSIHQIAALVCRIHACASPASSAAALACPPALRPGANYHTRVHPAGGS